MIWEQEKHALLSKLKLKTDNNNLSYIYTQWLGEIIVNYIWLAENNYEVSCQLVRYCSQQANSILFYRNMKMLKISEQRCSKLADTS